MVPAFTLGCTKNHQMNFAFSETVTIPGHPSIAVFSPATCAWPELLSRMNDLAGSSQPTAHFVQLYKRTTEQAALFYEDTDRETREFIEQLQTRFAAIFFEAWYLNEAGAAVPGHWQMFFHCRNLKPVQYSLLASNAHVNGDVCEALTDKFTEEEIRRQYTSFLCYNKGLLPVYDEFYQQVFQCSTSVRILHYLSAGLSKRYGYRCLRQWRRRQIELALLHYRHPTRFRLRMKWHRIKMKIIDQLIIHCV